ncbi:hypothetical protein CkaCkLH20_09346 [Colletotrichum karsti]|uniref:Uncharacterized protein n=1 Tax=Colletotrichum karsti TaxID=1095194 RepID=A0A9P6HYI0_9PEZI|nr:uncharacterized protein CkaCkLH20_09346 [Colletotrichum karsti]KAF9873183.1 hypothetical protein CkaCkLH20_09346 [Colletotrichum karsti]
MSDIITIKALLSLARSPDINVHLSVETSYGLVVEFKTGEGLSVHLKESTGAPEHHKTAEEVKAPPKPLLESGTLAQPEPPSEPEPQSRLETRPEPNKNVRHGNSKPGYSYAIDPDYGTSFLWYSQGHPGNPEGEFHIELEAVKDRYSASWCNAFREWGERYSKAFKAQECDLGSGNSVFPAVEERRNWDAEGAFLGAWLALQDGVDNVTYQPIEEEFVLRRDGIETVLGQILADISAH